MSFEINKTKTRIKSIKNTQKITNAMELIATVKLKKFKDVFNSSNEYTNGILDLLDRLYLYKAEEYVQKNENTHVLNIIVTSNLGLCGSYNSDIYSFVKKNIQENEDLIVVGDKGFSHYKHEYNSLNDTYVFTAKNVDFADIKKLGNYVFKSFNSGKYSTVNLIYTKYINSLINNPELIQLLPYVVRNDNLDKFKTPLFEPDVDSIIEGALPLYVDALLYNKILESTVCEQSSRRRAMENANNNADDLLDKLSIMYNKARQAAITQEINEVVSGSNF